MIDRNSGHANVIITFNSVLAAIYISTAEKLRRVRPFKLTCTYSLLLLSNGYDENIDLVLIRSPAILSIKALTTQSNQRFISAANRL